MKIKLITADHSKKLQTIKLVRELTGMNLANAKRTVENTPSEFIAELPYEDSFAVESKFTKLGAIIIIQTGALERKESQKKRITSLEGALFYNEHEIEEKATLNSKEEVVEYLVRNQNYDKAKIAALTSSVIMAVTLTVYQYSIGYYSYWLLPLAGVIIGFAVKRAGKGVESKFGVIAAIYTVVSIFLMKIFLALSYIVGHGVDIASFLNLVYPDAITVFVGILSSLIAYKTSYKRVGVTQSNSRSSQSVSDLIEEKKAKAKGVRYHKSQSKKEEEQQRDARYNWKREERPGAGKPKK